MIEGNHNHKRVYAHKETIVCKLVIAGWPPHIAGDEIPVEVIGSAEVFDNWSYTAWVPLASGQKVLMEFRGLYLFETYQAAIAERLTEKQRRELYKYERHYHYKAKKPLFLGRRNPGKWWADLLKGFVTHNFLAKKHQACTPSLPACDDKTTGRGLSHPAPYFIERGL